MRYLKALWEWWKPLARKIGDFQARVILTVFYFVFLSPFALIVRFATDPLAIKPKTPRGWLLREDSGAPEAQRATKMFSL
ncbi:MAG: hypothetical protein ACT4NX_00600 [Deltaproteobacteria bacterium]